VMGTHPLAGTTNPKPISSPVPSPSSARCCRTVRFRRAPSCLTRVISRSV
jgi:hypothetical protein